MTKEEFVELHGEELWENLVEPTQRLGYATIRNNANIIIHNDFLMPLLRKISSTAKGFQDVKTH